MESKSYSARNSEIMPYSLILATLFSYKLFSGIPRSRVDTLYWTVFSGLFLFTALRNKVGCDWGNYQRTFYFNWEMTIGEALTRGEPVFWLVVYMLHDLGLQYHWLNIVTTAVFFFGLFKFSKKQNDPLGFLILAFPILIVNMPMSGIRQAAAIGVIMLAYCAYLENRPFRFVALVAIAAGFHISAITFFTLAPFSFFQKRKKLGLAVALVLCTPVAVLVSSSDAAELANERYVGTGIEAFGAIYRVGLVVATGFLFFYVRKAWRDRFPQDYSLALIGSIAMIALAALLPISSVVADRFAYYLIPLQLMTLTRLPLFFNKGLTKLTFAAPYVVLGTVFIVWISYSYLFSVCYLPYGIVSVLG